MTEQEIKNSVEEYKGSCRLLREIGNFCIEHEIAYNVQKYNAAFTLNLPDLESYYLECLNFLQVFALSEEELICEN